MLSFTGLQMAELVERRNQTPRVAGASPGGGVSASTDELLTATLAGGSHSSSEQSCQPREQAPYRMPGPEELLFGCPCFGTVSPYPPFACLNGRSFHPLLRTECAPVLKPHLESVFDDWNRFPTVPLICERAVFADLPARSRNCRCLPPFPYLESRLQRCMMQTYKGHFCPPLVALRISAKLPKWGNSLVPIIFLLIFSSQLLTL